MVEEIIVVNSTQIHETLMNKRLIIIHFKITESSTSMKNCVVLTMLFLTEQMQLIMWVLMDMRDRLQYLHIRKYRG